MKTFTVYFGELNRVDIEAENADQAREKFYDGEYDNPHFIEITAVEIIEN